jgi:RNA polymerase sigma-70 factor (ECF subfamily)
MTDASSELIIRAQEGDRSAQQGIVEAFSPMVFRLVSRFFHHREDVEDLAQDVFVKVLLCIHHVRPEEHFQGWLARITVNTCYDKLRRDQKRRIALETYHPEMSCAPRPEYMFTGPAQRAVAALDEKLRIPLILKEIEEMSVEEIARITGLTQTAVKVRLFRARKKLREVVAQSSI